MGTLDLADVCRDLIVYLYVCKHENIVAKARLDRGPHLTIRRQIPVFPT